MEFDLSTLQPKERASFALRALYEAAGCRKYHMGRFEEYSLYQANRSFLSSEQVITFTDLDGRLLALKPDVTLSIAKTAQPAPGETLRYYYHENVYRPSAESHTFKEIGQMGLEFLGGVGEAEVQQAVCLAAQSLGQLGTDWVLEVSHMGYLFGLLDALQVPEDARAGLLRKLGQKNAHELRAAALAAGLDEDAADTLCRVLTLCGGYADTLPRAEALCRNDAMRAAVAELQGLAGPLEQAGGAIRLDLTLAGEMEYYNGLVFQGYLKALPRPLLKGGRYDLLMQQFTPGAGAIGFAVYLDELDRLSAPLPPVQKNSTDKVMLNVALPKGRLGDKVYNLLAGIGYGCPEDYNATRKLVVENPAAGIRYFLVKPSDVAIYVEHGAADVGIVGKDILTEAEADVYELLDTGLGKCRMCVAAPADYQDDPGRPVRVATKFVNIAKAYYASQGRDIDIINMELVMADLEMVQRRVEKATKALKGDKKFQHEVDVFTALQKHLDGGNLARTFACDEDDAALIATSDLLTLKPVIYAANTDEAGFADLEHNQYYQQVKAIADAEDSQVLPICAKMEQDIAELEGEEKLMFLEELGVEESGLDRLIKCSYALLGLISFLTYGKDECRAWTIRKGTKAPQAAGKIHSDIERGFIRAETINFDEMMACGSVAAAKEKGLLRSEGKDYVVKDGDMIYFRFNV